MIILHARKNPPFSPQISRIVSSSHIRLACWKQWRTFPKISYSVSSHVFFLPGWAPPKNTNCILPPICPSSFSILGKILQLASSKWLFGKSNVKGMVLTFLTWLIEHRENFRNWKGKPFPFLRGLPVRVLRWHKERAVIKNPSFSSTHEGQPIRLTTSIFWHLTQSGKWKSVSELSDNFINYEKPVFRLKVAKSEKWLKWKPKWSDCKLKPIFNGVPFSHYLRGNQSFVWFFRLYKHGALC